MPCLRSTLVAVLALASTALGQQCQLSTGPIDGSGTIAVRIYGTTGFDGCLDPKGQWIKDGKFCGKFTADKGRVTMARRTLTLDPSGNITVSEGEGTMIWVATSVPGVTFGLRANPRGSGLDLWGGPLWFADQQPADDMDSVPLSGKSFNAPLQIALFWNSD